MSQQIINGDSAEVLKTIPSNTIDAVITDPPYGIEFLGKDWDRNTGAIEIWRECLRVLKPGGYLLAFSAARTYHQLATNIESVGFEIRDQLMWLYSSGFPKAQDIGKAIDKRAGKKDRTVLVAPTYGKNGEKTVSNSPAGQLRCPVCKKTSEQRYHCGQGQECGMVYKAQTPEARQWAGWKTALKPAHEPICMARKPFPGSTIDNVLTHGVGALNIDATRIESEPRTYPANGFKRTTYAQSEPAKWRDGDHEITHNEQGRFPSNVLGEVAGYQKFFYSPKVSRSERHRGFEQDTIPSNPSGMYEQNAEGKMGERYEARVEDKRAVGNNHPTVKPVELMKYLIKLVTAADAHIIDPFSGSGSTGMACRELGRQFTGIDLDSGYCEIARRRIAATRTDPREQLFE